MPRKSIERPVREKKFIDVKTGKTEEISGLPILCEKIRFFRESAGLEQKALAKEIGVTANAISNWENGRSRPDVNLLPDICRVLGVSIYDLYDLEDPGLTLSAGEKLFLEQYRQLSAGHRLAVRRLTQSLLEIQSAEDCPPLRKLICFKKSLAAGFGDPTEFEADGEPIFLYSSREADRSDYVFAVNGDSMEPQFKNGDRVLVSRISDAPTLQPGEIGAFIVGNETYIKVYREDCLESLNPSYSPLHFCDTESVYLIGRVTGILDPAQIAAPKDVEKYHLLHPESV